MSELFFQVCRLVDASEVRVSEHGYNELIDDKLTAREVIVGVQDGVVVEEYANYPKGPCLLLLQEDRAGKPIHVVWGIPIGYDKPVVLITAYRPDPKRWDKNFMKRQ